MGTGGVPVGNYKAQFVGVSETTGDWGDSWKWEFKVTEGKETGNVVSRFTNRKPSPKNAAGRMLRGVLGRLPAPAETVDIQSCTGLEYLVTMEPTDSGSTRIGAVIRVNAPAAAADDAPFNVESDQAERDRLIDAEVERRLAAATRAKSLDEAGARF
jgi:hypothetical protein